jgi:hypothetical protein
MATIALMSSVNDACLRRLATPNVRQMHFHVSRTTVAWVGGVVGGSLQRLADRCQPLPWRRPSAEDEHGSGDGQDYLVIIS